MGVNESDLSNIHLLKNIIQIFVIYYDQRNHMLSGDYIQGEGIYCSNPHYIAHFSCFLHFRTVFLVKKHGYIVVVEARIYFDVY